MHIIVYYTSDKSIPIAISQYKNVVLLWSNVKEAGNLGCFCIVLLYAVLCLCIHTQFICFIFNAKKIKRGLEIVRTR